MLSALIQNFDTVEKVIETSANSAGSALKENERYLDSIQGKIDQFNNSMQTMWSNTLDSDLVKGIVALGTEIINIIDGIGLLNSALLAFGAYEGFGALFKGLKKDGVTLKSVWTWINQLTLATRQQQVADAAAAGTTLSRMNAENLLNLSIVKRFGTEQIDAKVKEANRAREVALIAAKQALALAEEQYAAGLIDDIALQNAKNAVDAASIPITSGQIGVTGILSATFKGLAVSIWSAVKAIAAFLFTNPIGWIILAVGAVAGGIAAWNKWGDTTENLREKLEGLKSELSDLESEIDSLNSELKTAQNRMAELIAMPSLSFIEQEELANLKQTTAELERQLQIKEMLASNKKDAVIAAYEKNIDKIWHSTGIDKAYYAAEDGIRKDEGWGGFWNGGSNTKDLLDTSIRGYDRSRKQRDTLQTVLAQWDDDNAEANKELLKKHGLQYYYDKGDIEEFLELRNKDLESFAANVNLIFSDEAFDGLEYGMSDKIDTFLDEMYAYQLKWKQAQGEYVKSDAISSMFDATSTKEMQEFGKALREIVDGDDTDAKKTATILKNLDAIDGIIGDGINKVDGATDAYGRLFIAMETVGVTAQDIADYFVLETGVFDSNTIQGIANQYQHMESVMGALKNMSNNKFTFDGVEYNWDEFFSQDDQGKFKAKAIKFSEILSGMDEKSRETFINIVESAANSAGELSKIDWNQALSKLDFSGLDRTLTLLNDEFEGLNNEMFASVADDINGLIDTVSELQVALEDVASTMDLLSTAQKQMSNSGQISVKTALDLMSATDDYNKVVTIENGVLKLATGAQDYLTQSKFNSIKAQLEASATLAETNYQTALAAQSELNYADNASIVMTAESIKAEAIGRVSAVIVALGAAMDAIERKEYGSIFSSFSSTYKSATATVVAQSNSMKTSIAELERDAKNKRTLADVYSFANGYENFNNNYDFDKTPGDKSSEKELVDDAFQREMDYWENRIAANQAKYEQIQNEIDLLEKKGQKADASYYQEQAKLENQRLELLNGQKAAAKAYLDTLVEGSEEWWSTAEVLNDLESDIDDVTASLVDLQDAIAEIDTYKFEEFNTRLDNLVSKLSTIRDLIAPDGEESWFDDNGDWTEEGVAVLGSYLQELEMYKQGYAETVDELNKYAASYEGNESYYEALGIHSEQEWYDKTEELISQQYDFAESISDTEQSVVDMYENSIDAVEEYMETLIDSYNDYIDSVKEALDAERDLYDFKKNVEKQSKDIAAIERRIASLSGSTNASDIAERRKLEQQLYESRESLNDTYYDHARNTQDAALDAEQTAYEESITKFIEGLRISLEEATLNMDEFLMGVTSMVMYNADIVLDKYEETNLPLTTELTNPWIKAKEAVGSYSGNALDLMNQWTKEGGFFAQFNSTGTANLQSPWNSGTNAANAFKANVTTVMSGVVSNIATNVKTASGELSKLYQQIIDTEKRAQGANLGDGGGLGADDPPKTPPKTPTKYQVTATLQMPDRTLIAKGVGETATKAKAAAQIEIAGEYEKYQKLQGKSEQSYENAWLKTYRSRVKYGDAVPMYAKGTTGTPHDQWALTDEFGDELVLVPGKDGNLSFMRKGTGVVPADLTANLMEWGQFTPSSLNLGSGVNVNMINNAVNKPEFNFVFDALVKAENITEETLPAVKKLVTQELNRFTKELNYALKGKGAR